MTDWNLLVGVFFFWGGGFWGGGSVRTPRRSMKIIARGGKEGAGLFTGEISGKNSQKLPFQAKKIRKRKGENKDTLGFNFSIGFFPKKAKEGKRGQPFGS